MTIRMNFFFIASLVAREDAQAGVALAASSPQSRAERRCGQGLEVAERWDERERRDGQPGQRCERGGTSACSAAAKRSPHELERSEATEDAADRASELLLP